MEIQRPRRSCTLVVSSGGGLNITKNDTINLPNIFEYLELYIMKAVHPLKLKQYFSLQANTKLFL